MIEQTLPKRGHGGEQSGKDVKKGKCRRPIKKNSLNLLLLGHPHKAITVTVKAVSANGYIKSGRGGGSIKHRLG